MGNGNQEDAVERGEEGAECCVSIEGVRGMVETEGMELHWLACFAEQWNSTLRSLRLAGDVLLLLEMGYRDRSITIMTQLYSALLSAMFAIWLLETWMCAFA